MSTRIHVHRFVTATSLLLTAVLAVVLVSALPAAASPAPDSAAAHCILPAEGMSPASPTGCYATQDQAIAAITGSAGIASPSTNVVQAIFYTGLSHTGNSLTFYAGAVCSGTATWTWPNFQPPWKDAFQSGTLYAGCKGRMYPQPTLSGQPTFAFSVQQSVNTMGTFNKKGESYRSCGPSAACL